MITNTDDLLRFAQQFRRDGQYFLLPELLERAACELEQLRYELAKSKSDTATCCMVAGQVAKEAVL